VIFSGYLCCIRNHTIETNIVLKYYIIHIDLYRLDSFTFPRKQLFVVNVSYIGVFDQDAHSH
jgi:hypothetical protein